MGEGMSINPDGKDREPELDKLLRGLCCIVLRDSKNVRRVGVFGSYARGKENPRDIDLAYFVDDDVAMDFLEESEKNDDEKRSPKFLKWAEETGHNPSDELDYEIFFHTEILGMDPAKVNQFIFSQIMIQEMTGKPIQETLLSNNPSTRYIYFMALTQRDPTFLENLTKDIKILDPNSGQFKPEEIYTDEIIDRIKNESFHQIKELSNNSGISNLTLDEIEADPRHKDLEFPEKVDRDH